MKILAFVLLSALSFAQTPVTKPATAAKPKQSQAAPANKTATPAATKPAETKAADAAPPVAMDAVVLTIPGVCPANTPAESCSTRMTRADFERLLSAINPNMPAESRKQVATSYAQVLAMAGEAQKMGVDKDPTFQVQLHLQTLTMLAQGMQKRMFEASKPTPQEVDSFYAENAAKFEELSLRRIVVLKSASSDMKPEQVKEIAENIHQRAVAGEDPDKLEAEAFKETKSAGAPPNTDLGWKRHGSMDPRHEPQILALHAGEVSPVLEDGQAYYIYKVVSKRLVPKESVEKDIETAIQSDHARAKLQRVLDLAKPQLNEAYFGAEKPAAPAVPPAAPPK